ncbi:MAG: FHA domain-containing protein [Thermoanaerobaculaceae bacterium]|nr:FHA domain-containing protein [Thermoanaerobaculaceae bacterium]MDI9621790.1 FHA domain-containing protein [Acidobacteriota bacterium]NLH11688.1 FHA domain-containing protein [Holophagae bacterium]HPW56520.1 FHA domain-containing protein [Thermoanaerobaculaceae bacterium]
MTEPKSVPISSPSGPAASRPPTSRRGVVATATAAIATQLAEGVTIEVLEGPLDGARWSGSGPRVTIGRAASNSFPIPLDRSVSSRHAALTWDAANGTWVIEDLRSTNGTWLEGARISSPQPIESGTDFILGYAVVRFVAGSVGESFNPDPNHLRQEATRLTARLSPTAALGFGAAVMMASQEKRSYVTDRQMLVGLASLNPDLLAGVAGSGLTPAFISETLRRNEVWTGARAWIARHLRAVAMDESVLFLNEILLTPRLVRLLQAADREAGEAAIEPLHVLRAILADGNNRPCELLRREGGVPADILATTQAPAPVHRQATTPTSSVEESMPMQVALSSGDLAMDARTHEMARTIENLAALYHLAEPEERHKALRQALTDEVGRLTPPNRQRFFNRLRAFFPVLPGARVDVGELAALRRRIAELEGKPRQAPPSTPEPKAATSWSRLIGELTDGPAEPGLVAARAVVEFAVSAERFIAATAHNLTTRGNVTEAVAIPGFRTSLRKLLPPAIEGKAGALGELQTYLAAVERWLVATTAAYHESPAIWFSGFWSRMSPAAIEASVSEGSRKKVFRIEAVELWSQFKELARSITAELVADEVLLVTGKRAFEQYDRLSERKDSQ